MSGVRPGLVAGLGRRVGSSAEGRARTRAKLGFGRVQRSAVRPCVFSSHYEGVVEGEGSDQARTKSVWRRASSRWSSSDLSAIFNRNTFFLYKFLPLYRLSFCKSFLSSSCLVHFWGGGKWDPDHVPPTSTPPDPPTPPPMGSSRVFADTVRPTGTCTVAVPKHNVT